MFCPRPGPDAVLVLDEVNGSGGRACHVVAFTVEKLKPIQSGAARAWSNSGQCFKFFASVRTANRGQWARANHYIFIPLHHGHDQVISQPESSLFTDKVSHFIP